MYWWWYGSQWIVRKIPFLISESDILRSFQHLVEKNDNDFVVVGSGDDAAVIKSQKKDLVHSKLMKNISI